MGDSRDFIKSYRSIDTCTNECPAPFDVAADNRAPLQTGGLGRKKKILLFLLVDEAEVAGVLCCRGHLHEIICGASRKDGIGVAGLQGGARTPDFLTLLLSRVAEGCGGVAIPVIKAAWREEKKEILKLE